MNGRSHYDVLGVSNSASADSIRESYRRLAREFHPDRVQGSAAGGDKMPQINEAYRVLSDPGRRAVYDAERRGVAAPVGSPASTQTTVDDELPDYRFAYPEGPARIPWRGLLVCSLVAIVAIVVLAQFGDSSGPAAPDNILRIGECVEILPSGMAGEVVCSGDGDLVVRQVTPRQGVCPDGAVSVFDRQGMVGVCLEQMPVDPTLG